LKFQAFRDAIKFLTMQILTKLHVTNLLLGLQLFGFGGRMFTLKMEYSKDSSVLVLKPLMAIWNAVLMLLILPELKNGSNCMGM
jgi:hypothetical protein